MQTTQIALLPMILQVIRKMDKEEFLLGPIKCYVVSILRLLRERDECVREKLVNLMITDGLSGIFLFSPVSL